MRTLVLSVLRSLESLFEAEYVFSVGLSGFGVVFFFGGGEVGVSFLFACLGLFCLFALLLFCFVFLLVCLVLFYFVVLVFAWLAFLNFHFRPG